MTNFEVDGESVPQYAATSVVIDVMDDSSAKQAFLKGELAEWSPSPEEVFAFATSDRLYKVDDTFTMSFFFNCGLKSLQTMDASKGNTNSVVLSSTNFRKAMSLAIDRAEYVTATQGYKPAYSLMNNLYHYDIFNDPTSSYRGSDEAMQAICNLYGVKYGEGTPYATLKDAYQSITGYNLTEAKELFAAACKELVEAGLYKEGEPIVIRIGWAAGALQSADNKQCEILTKQLNAALEGSGFGTLTLEAVGNINNRYADVANGEYAIGYGAWGGAALYPFRNFQCYCDTDQYDVNEIGCWDPATEMLTLNVNGEDVTMSWKDWSGALIGTGRFTDADFATKLYVTAQMEELYLQKYYRIPLAGKTNVKVISSPQVLIASNNEAKISVGSKVPIVNSEITNTQSIITNNTDASTNLVRNIQYQDTGVILKITPKVTRGGRIAIKLAQTVSEADSNTVSDIDSPVIKEQIIETAMSLRDGQTIICGGIIREKSTDNLSTLPGLGGIPFLRRLFGDTDISTDRTEMMILITGYIVSEDSHLEELVKRYEQAVDALIDFHAPAGQRKRKIDQNKGLVESWFIE